MGHNANKQVSYEDALILAYGTDHLRRKAAEARAEAGTIKGIGVVKSVRRHLLKANSQEIDKRTNKIESSIPKN